MTEEAPSDNPIFRLRQVTRSYGDTWELHPLTLTAHPGELVAVVGPSGSGKTTLLNLLAGITRPDRGEILLGGNDLSEMRPGRELARWVGVVHQQYDLVPHLSVLHNVLAGRLGSWGLLRSLASLVRPVERGSATRALARVGLAEKRHERTSRLSGGEQQRVAIARLLVQDPEIIIADEPVSSLDPARARDLMGMLAGIATESGKTLFASVHSVDLVRDYFSRAIGLRQGRLAFDLSVAELTDDLLRELYDLEEVKSGAMVDP